jgi:membrane protease YdiL (CAAX protease family)
MYAVASQLSENLIQSAAMLAVSACVVAWLWAAVQWWQRRPILPYEPRRPVPWHAIDLAIIVVFYLAMQSGVIALADACLGPAASRTPATYDATGSQAEHIVAQLIAEGNPWVFLLCIVSAGLVAPITEEFFFRVLLQGWLQALQHRWRRQMPTLRRLVPGGVGPIVLTSLLFARLHFRVDTPPINLRFLLFVLAGDAGARLLTSVFAVAWLRWHVSATAADLGWTPKNTPGDLKLGLVTFMAVAAPVYAVQKIAFRYLLPAYIAPDPLPLFFFALVLGALYYRTHRILPSIVLHAALNGTSLVLAWLSG